MYAIAFDLVVADATAHHPKSVSQAYLDICDILSKYKFDRVQGSLYVTDNEDMQNLFKAILALKAEPWFPKCVRDIRAFRIEQWSSFNDIMKA